MWMDSQVEMKLMDKIQPGEVKERKVGRLYGALAGKCHFTPNFSLPHTNDIYTALQNQVIGVFTPFSIFSSSQPSLPSFST